MSARLSILLAVIAASIPSGLRADGLAGAFTHLPHGAYAQSSEFEAALLLTADDDWERKLPAYTFAQHIKQGDVIHAVTLFAHPRRDSAGLVNLRCSYAVTGPDGEVDARQDFQCFQPKGKVAEDFSIASNDLEIEIDAKGEWRVQVQIRDMNAGVALPLEARFKVQ